MKDNMKVVNKKEETKTNKFIEFINKTDKNNIDARNNIGSPIAVRSYVKAYHYCMEKFNCKNFIGKAIVCTDIRNIIKIFIHHCNISGRIY